MGNGRRAGKRVDPVRLRQQDSDGVQVSRGGAPRRRVRVLRGEEGLGRSRKGRRARLGPHLPTSSVRSNGGENGEQEARSQRAEHVQIFRCGGSNQKGGNQQPGAEERTWHNARAALNASLGEATRTCCTTSTVNLSGALAATFAGLHSCNRSHSRERKHAQARNSVSGRQQTLAQSATEAEWRGHAAFSHRCLGNAWIVHQKRRARGRVLHEARRGDRNAVLSLRKSMNG